VSARLYIAGLALVAVGGVLAMHLSVLAGGIIAGVGYLLAGCSARSAGA
jgi:hypothetical protein